MNSTDNYSFMANISFCIPSKNNLRYLRVAIAYLREMCANPNHEILVWVDKDDDGTSTYLKELNDPNVRYWVNERPEPFGIGNAYDFLVSQASNDLVMMYHADMIAGKDMDVAVLQHIGPNIVVSATRIEPPLHPGDPSKVTRDLGLWPEPDVRDGFKESTFVAEVELLKREHNGKTTPGIFAPWLIYKQNYQELGGHDPRLNSLAEDIDIFNRMALANYKLVQTWEGYVYHLTCRGGQFEHATTTTELRQRSNEWNVLSFVKTREFIRKWGFEPMAGELREPIIWPQIKRTASIMNCRGVDYNLVKSIEPYFTHIRVDNNDIKERYVREEQASTNFDLQDKFTECDDCFATISFDIQRLNAQHFSEFIRKLPLILDGIEEAGYYEYDIFGIEVHTTK